MSIPYGTKIVYTIGKLLTHGRLSPNTAVMDRPWPSGAQRRHSECVVTNHLKKLTDKHIFSSDYKITKVNKNILWS